MSFFERYNNRPVPVTFDYMTNTGLPLFKLMKIMSVESATTAIGDTVKLSVITGEGQRYYFYLNNEDYVRFADGDYAFLNSEISAGRNPFAISCKTTGGLRTAILSFSKC